MRQARRVGFSAMLTGLSIAAAAAEPGAGLPPPSGVTAGDAQRGRAIVASRQLGMCLLCHSGPIAEERFQGDLAPSLAGAGRRWSAAQLRERIVDARRFDPATIMPPYGSVEGLARIAPAARGRPLLDAQQIEDVVAWLATLQD